MIGCLRTRVRKQPLIALYFEFENELKFYNVGAWSFNFLSKLMRAANCVLFCLNPFCPEVNDGCLPCLFVFVALRPKSTAMVIAGRSVHLTTLFPGQA